MQNLGKITNHHLVITDEEQLNIVNALAFFHAMFDPARDVSRDELIKEWQDVASDTFLPRLDELTTRIATI